jgi:hypothetical protein
MFRVVEESTDRQDLELIQHIRDNRMGIIVDSYKDVASARRPGILGPATSMRSWTSLRDASTVSRASPWTGSQDGVTK